MINKQITIVFMTLISVLAGCSRESSADAQGYIEGRYTYMATSVSGVLKKLLVARGTQVKQGQPLFLLEEQPESDAYQAAVENYNQAVAARDAISANLDFAKLTYERNKILVRKNAVQQSLLDSAKANYDALTAQLSQQSSNIASLKAQLAQSKWQKEQKLITAPVDALVFDTYYRLGEYTVANKPILSLLAPADIKAIFYVNEPSLGHLHLGDKVSVKCDGCQKPYDGRVSFISPTAEYTPPVIYSTETSDKLVYRIEAEFAKQDAIHLHPGQPVTTTYHFHD
ncbi:MAG: HlyD family secretion protein [Gammaproteobacteria bacterium]